MVWRYNVLAVRGNPRCVGGLAPAQAGRSCSSFQLPCFFLFSLIFNPLQRIFYSISFMKEIQRIFQNPFLFVPPKRNGFCIPKKNAAGGFRFPPYPLKRPKRGRSPSLAVKGAWGNIRKFPQTFSLGSKTRFFVVTKKWVLQSEKGTFVTKAAF